MESKDTDITEVKTTEIQAIDTQVLAIQSASPIMQLAPMLASGKITAEQMEKMLDAQIKWEGHEAEKAYHVAMAKFQENAPAIIKSKQGHNCMHADLAIDIVAKVAPLLSEQGLSHKWVTKSMDGGVEVTCKITHVQGYSESTSMFAGHDTSGSKNAIQAIGSTVTYLQRYTLKAALGLAEGGQDDDGNAACQKPAPQIRPATTTELEVIDAICEALLPSDNPVNKKVVTSILIENCRDNLLMGNVAGAAEWLKGAYKDATLYIDTPEQGNASFIIENDIPTA